LKFIIDSMILNYLRPCKPQVEVQSKICFEKFAGRTLLSHLRFLYLGRYAFAHEGNPQDRNGSPRADWLNFPQNKSIRC